MDQMFLKISSYAKEIGHIYETGDFAFYFYGLMKMNFNYPLIGMADLTHGIPHVDLPQEKKYT